MFTFWDVSIFGTLFTYGLLVDRRILYIWSALLAVYVALGVWVKGKSIHLRRRVNDLGTFRPPVDPNVYAKLEVCLDKADEFIERKRKEGITVTYTHIGIRALGAAFASCMKDNGKIVFGKFIPLPSVDVHAILDLKNGKEAQGITIRGCHTKTISEIQKDIKEKLAEKLKKESGKQQGELCGELCR
jgi:hypothetical protein